MEITEAEYHQHSALNSSRLAVFYQGPDYALMPVEPKPSWEFGHVFETYVQQESERSTVFNDRYFVGKGLRGSIPEKLMKAINEGTSLEDVYVYTDKGKRNLRQAKLHAWLDAQIANIGKSPVSVDDLERAKRMTDNLFKTPFRGSKLRIILERAKWQVPFFWIGQGIKKRGLADIVVEEDGVVELLADLKSVASPQKFRSAARDRLWIQALHYREGILSGDSDYVELWDDCMWFLPVQNVEPWVAFEPVRLHYKDQFAKGEDAEMLMKQKYQNLCEDYRMWELSGKPARGYVDVSHVNVWV